MKTLVFSFAIAALAFSTGAQTPTTPTKFGTAATGTAAAATGTATEPKAKPIAPTDKKWVKDVSEAILIEQKYLQLVVDNKTATYTEETKRATGPIAGDLKRIWTSLATLATTKGAEVAQDVSKNDVAKVQKLQKEKADKFEKEFFKEFAKETKQTAKIFDSAKTVQDADLKKFAEDWAVTIKGHESTVETTEKQLSKKK